MRTGNDLRTVLSTVPFPIASFDRRTIKAVIEPRDRDLYASLVPAPLTMPERPRLLVEFYRFTDKWHEASLSIACRYGNEDGWHGLYWPVDSYLPHKTGRLIGYPKSLVSAMRLSCTEQGCQGDVRHEGRAEMTLSFEPRDGASSDPIGAPQHEHPYFMLVPPGEGPKLERVVYRNVHSAPRPERNGTVRVAFDVDARWRGLLPDSEASGPATLFAQDGMGLGFLLARAI